MVKIECRDALVYDADVPASGDGWDSSSGPVSRKGSTASTHAKEAIIASPFVPVLSLETPSKPSQSSVIASFTDAASTPMTRHKRPRNKDLRRPLARLHARNAHYLCDSLGYFQMPLRGKNRPPRSDLCRTTRLDWGFLWHRSLPPPPSGRGKKNRTPQEAFRLILRGVDVIYSIGRTMAKVKWSDHKNRITGAPRFVMGGVAAVVTSQS